MWRDWKAIRVFIMTCLNPALLSKRLRDLLQSSLASLTRTRLMSGHLGSPGKTLLWPAPTPVFAGRTMRLSRTIAAGTGRTPITITIGTIRFMTALAIPAVTIRSNLAMITFTARTPLAQRLAMTAWVTRSAWLPGRNGSGAVTWTWATAHRPDTSSAWNGS